MTGHEDTSVENERVEYMSKLFKQLRLRIATQKLEEEIELVEEALRTLNAAEPGSTRFRSWRAPMINAEASTSPRGA